MPSPRTLVQDIDEELERICLKALAPRAENRYTTAAEFQTALEEYIGRHTAMRATSKELGKYVSDLFAKERAKITFLIEAQLAKRERDSGANIANLSTLFGATPASEPISHVRQKRRTSVVALAVVALVAAVAMVTALLTRTSGHLATAQATSRVVIRVTPTEAKVFFDDAPMAGNPPTGTFVLDHAQHRVRAEAAGYTTRTDLLNLDSAKVTFELPLEPAPVAPPPVSVTALATATPQQARPPMVLRAVRPAATHPTEPTVTVSAAAPPPPSAATPAHSGLQLDKSNPWQ